MRIAAPNHVAAAIALAVLAGARIAAAQIPERSSEETATPFPVVIERNALISSTELIRDGSTLARCTDSCTVSLVRGRYMVRITEPSGRSSKKLVDLDGPAQLLLTPPDRGLSALGLTLGIVGAVTFTLSGTVLLVRCGVFKGCGSESPDERWIAPAAATGFIVGAIATPVGWYLFGEHRKVHIDAFPLPMYPNGSGGAARPWTLGAVRAPAGGMAAIELSF